MFITFSYIVKLTPPFSIDRSSPSMDEQLIKHFQLTEKAYDTEKRRKELEEKIEKWQGKQVDVISEGDISEDKKMYTADQLNTNVAKAENEKAQVEDQLPANLTAIGNGVCFLLFFFNPLRTGVKTGFLTLFFEKRANGEKG